MKKRLLGYFNLLPIIIICGCVSTAVFNQRAYEQDVNIKVDALALVDKADQPYMQHADEVGQFKLNIEKAYQYAKGLPNNNETIAQWEIIRNPNEASIAGFLERWKSEGQLSRVFIEDAKIEIGKQFDQVIELESGKRK